MVKKTEIQANLPEKKIIDDRAFIKQLSDFYDFRERMERAGVALKQPHYSIPLMERISYQH